MKAGGLALLLVLALIAWWALQPNGLPEGITGSNGRIEAVEIDIATKTAGRIDEILVNEGDFVTRGQPLAKMNTAVLNAQLREAEAQLQSALIGIETAQSQVRQREAELESTKALVLQRQAELDAAEAQLNRTEKLAARGNASRQKLDDDRAAFQAGKAALGAATANVAAAEAALGNAKAAVIAARSTSEAVRATIQRIQADIDDSTLTSPRDGRVQYRVAQPGEVLSAGGTVLNMVDLSDVYMTFFLPTESAGRVALGSEARIVLDAAPQYVIAAKVSYVSDVAQFTPKTVETVEERLKLTFRLKARIDPALLKRHLRQIKTGLPGMAYVKIDPEAAWPSDLLIRQPE
ncbi:HlyD family secretion protein [Parvibaculum indicum]|nr:HlyD family secretion protein [Parvibaculum indicum]